MRASAAAQPSPRVARILAAGVIALGVWLLAQAVVLAQQAASAHAQQGERTPSLLRWSLAAPEAIIGPGSEGIASASRVEGRLRAAGQSTVLDVSLALDGRPLPLDVLQQAQLVAYTDQPVTVTLIAARDEGVAGIEIGRSHLLPPGGTLRLPLHAPFARANVLRLRLQRNAPGTLDLVSLRLIPAQGRGCRSGWCNGAPEQLLLAPAATPERFLAARDRLVDERPLAVPAVAGVPAWLGWAVERAAARAVPAAGWLSLLVLAWAVWSRWRDHPPHGGGMAELLPLFAIPVLLLALGLPAPDSAVALLAFLVCCLAALLHPGGRHDWRWLGDSAAWRSAARVTAAGIAVVVLLLALDLLDGDGRSAASWSWERVARYLPWALLQQSLLLVAIAPRAGRNGRDRRSAALLAGAVFALLHLPNFALMIATFAAGSAWARSGVRHGALLPLALSHWLLGTLVVLTAPDWLLRSAEIGGRFLMPGG